MYDIPMTWAQILKVVKGCINSISRSVKGG